MTSPVRVPRFPVRPSLVLRETEARELMDDPDCDLDALERTYTHFRVVNALVAGWRRVYTARLRPLLSPSRPTSLLDIGCGGGDVPRALARWAARDGLVLDITAIDPDPRAAAFAEATFAAAQPTAVQPTAAQTTAAQPTPARLIFARTTSAELVGGGAQFDVVTSNHLLHHLAPVERDALLADSQVLARRLVVHNDIARSAVAYGAYHVGTWPWRRRRPDATFIHDDGLLSIRRSYRPDELAAVVPPGWQVVRQFPYRLLLVLDGRAGGARA